MVNPGPGRHNHEQKTDQSSNPRRTHVSEEAWKLGRELRQAKSQVRHGQWIRWIEESIGLTPRTAQRLMALHEAYPEMRHVSHLRGVIARVVGDVLFVVGADSTSQRVAKDALEQLSQSGARVVGAVLNKAERRTG